MVFSTSHSTGLNPGITESHPRTEEFAVKHWIRKGKWETYHQIPTHTLKAFEEARQFVDNFYGSDHTGPQPIVLDSGCGVGMSTFKLGERHIGIPVIGIDKSEKRLEKRLRVGREDVKGVGLGTNKTATGRENVKLVRADLIDFWTLVHRCPRLEVPV